jgi:pyruvate-formate lyase-activating enzyme
MRHLERCALEYGCPAAKNFFLGRYEAPLPTAVTCNANCLGCISLQTENNLVACQERISFTPAPEEIAGVALEHISRTPGGIVSFGQGCEGDPLTAFQAIEPAIRRIRQATDQGTINMNTNAGMPGRLGLLFDAGLDSVRVSMNSVREACYTAYFRPRSYRFDDVMASIRLAGEKGRFVSLNYLNCPGVTDSELEFRALCHFLAEFPVSMIQWRNMNFDPAAYLRIMTGAGGRSPALGMAFVLDELRRQFPGLVHGYFNPPRESFPTPAAGKDSP